MIKRNWVIGILAAFGLGIPSQGLFAADNNMAMLFIVDGNIHQEEELYNAIKAHAEWRMKEGDPWDWKIFRVVVGENLGRYYIRSGGHTLADFDAYAEFLAKGHVEWNKNVMPYVAAEMNRIMVNDKELTNWPAGHPNTYISVNEFHMKPGQYYKFRESAKTVHDTIMANDYPSYYTVATTWSGGSEEIVNLVFPAGSYAELGGPEEDVFSLMTRIHGEEKAGQVFGQFNSTYKRNVQYILKNMPELNVTAKK